MAVSYYAAVTLTAIFTYIRFGFALKAAQTETMKLAIFATRNNGSNKVGLDKIIMRLLFACLYTSIIFKYNFLVNKKELYK